MKTYSRSKSLMDIKLDMNNAYDRVEWGFLSSVMDKMGSAKCINTIMGYLSSASLSILINGHPTKFFRPSRGLRQGCPLSPYLFLLCSQALSTLLKGRVHFGGLRGITCARQAPEITHDFFTDDTLLFGQADMKFLDIYEFASGQSINQSSITFSPSTFSLIKSQIFVGLPNEPQNML